MHSIISNTPFFIFQVILFVICKITYAHQGYTHEKPASAAEGCVHPIYVPVYTKAQEPYDVFYNKVNAESSPAPYSAAPIVSVYVTSTPKPYTAEKKSYSAEAIDVKYAPQVAPTYKQSYAKAVYQSTSKPNYAYSASSEKYDSESKAKYEQQYISNTALSSDYSAGTSQIYYNPIRYSFISPAVGSYVVNKIAPSFHSTHGKSTGQNEHKGYFYNKAGAYAHDSVETAYNEEYEADKTYSKEAEHNYVSSTPYPASTYASSTPHSLPTYVSSTPHPTPSYVSSTSYSAPSHPTLLYTSSTPSPAYVQINSYIKPTLGYSSQYSATVEAAYNQEATNHYDQEGYSGNQYAGSYFKEYLPPKYNHDHPKPLSIYVSSAPYRASEYKSHSESYGGRSYSSANQYRNVFSAKHDAGYIGEAFDNSALKLNAHEDAGQEYAASPYQYSAQYAYSSAPATYSAYSVTPTQSTAVYSTQTDKPSYATYLSSIPSYSSHSGSYSTHSVPSYAAHSAGSAYFGHNTHSGQSYSAPSYSSHSSSVSYSSQKRPAYSLYPATALSGYSGHGGKYSNSASLLEDSKHASSQKASKYTSSQSQYSQATGYAVTEAPRLSYYEAQPVQYVVPALVQPAVNAPYAQQPAAHSAHAASVSASTVQYSPFTQYAATPVAQYAAAAVPLTGIQYQAPSYTQSHDTAYQSIHVKSDEHQRLHSVASQHEEYYVSTQNLFAFFFYKGK